MSERSILVLRQKIHGMNADGYAEAIAERLPEYDITLAQTPAEERAALANASIVTGLELEPAELEIAGNLELFACVFAGTSHLDIDAFEDRDVAVTNASGVHGPNMAEFVVGTMIAHAHRFKRAWRQGNRHEWRSYKTDDLTGSRATVIGLGSIGQAIVDRLQAFDMTVTGVRYSPEKGGPVQEVYGFDEIHEAVAGARYVILACPLTETTEGLIDTDVFQTMDPDALLVNVARGPVVETEALVSALRSNAIGGAALDVTDPEPLPADHPLWQFDNVFITPHNSGYTPEYFVRVADILAKNVRHLDENASDQLQNRVV